MLARCLQLLNVSPKSTTQLSHSASRLLSSYAFCLALCVFFAVSFSGSALAQPESIPMRASTSGTYYLSATAAGHSADFMLDTGAGLVTVNEKTFAAIKKRSGVSHVRQIGARLANNKIKLIEVYQVDQFAVGNCELGPLEVAVMKGGGRNLLGLSALGLAAPISIQLTPPSLSLSNCKAIEGLAASF